MSPSWTATGRYEDFGGGHADAVSGTVTVRPAESPMVNELESGLVVLVGV